MKKNLIFILAVSFFWTWSCTPDKQQKAANEKEEEVKTETKKTQAQPDEKALENAAQKQKAAEEKPTDAIQVQTNYFDLPEAKADKLSNMLGAEKLNPIGSPALNVMKNYLADHVLNGQSPYGRRLSSNYFHFVYNALPGFVSDMERHSGYNKGQGPTSERKQLMAYSIYRLDRSAENIKRLFAFGKPMLKTLVPQASYDHDYARLVNSRVQGYEALLKIKDFDIKLNEFYDEYFTENGELKDKELAGGAYGFSVYDLNQKIAEHLGAGDRMGGHPRALSFWMRRCHEGNQEVVYNILSEIQEMYTNG